MTESKPKRRWFRFSLRTFLIAVAIIGGWLGWNLYEVRQRDVFMQNLTASGASVEFSPPARPLAVLGTPPWSENRLPIAWRLFGAKPVYSIQITDLSGFTCADGRVIAARFPEADVTFLDSRSERVEACAPR